MTLENTASVPPPVSIPSSDKALMILCHISSLIGVGFVLPFIVWLVKKSDDDRVCAHAKETLNFHLSFLIYALCCIPLAFVWIGIPILITLALAGIVLAIVGALKASDGILYRYPLTMRMIS